MIDISHIDNAKRVNKPWGYELWLQCSENIPYSMKILHVNAGSRLSLQAHAIKSETMVVLSGTGMLHCSDQLLNIEKWESCAYSTEEVASLLSSIKEVPISEGTLLTITPGNLHRIVAVTDIRILESSTNNLTDVIRISDDHNRPSGHIQSEHS